MSELIFNNEILSQYGLPRACLCCGNDDASELTLNSNKSDTLSYIKNCLVSTTLMVFVFPLLSVVFNTSLIWLFIPSYIIISIFNAIRRNGKVPLALPICTLCQQAGARLNKRLVGALFGIPVLMFTIGTIIDKFHIPESNYVVGTSYVLLVILMLVLLLENIWLRHQFFIQVKKTNSTRTVIKVPYENYGVLYQRHVDNASLYGSSEGIQT